jgi:ATP-dependent Clp protease ATP-binding subunit ClpC
MIVGSGNSAGAMDGGNILKPALARAEIQVIGATTLDEYRENIEKDGALTRRFQPILIEEPTIEECTTILMNIKDKFEKFHKVTYTNEAIVDCVKLSSRYITDKFLPDKAIDIMDEAGAATNVSIEKPESIRELEKQKVDIVERKRIVVKNQNFEVAAKLRNEEDKINLQLRTALDEWSAKLTKTNTNIGVELIGETISMMTGIPLNKISNQDGKHLIEMEKELNEKIIGQENAVSKVVKAIKRNRVGIGSKTKPQGVFIFAGISGGGKSMLAKLIAEQLFGDIDSLVRIDLSEYMEAHSVSRLLGSPPGYIGHSAGGQLTEKIRRKPYSVILFDEIEKAHPDVFNVFLQLLDEGHLTDGLGRKINFKNTIIIMTSNLGVKELEFSGKAIGFTTTNLLLNEAAREKAIIEKAFKSKFKPEFLNRIDEIVIFNKLTKEDIRKVVYTEVKKLENRLDELSYKIKLDEDVIDFLADKGYDEEYGARPLARCIQHYIEDQISDLVLNDEIKDGATIKISLDKEKDGLILKPTKSTKSK